MSFGANYICDGQMDLFDFIPKNNSLAREKCLYNENNPCNIINAHDVARELGFECQYGCCRNCKHKQLCGAACNNRYEKATQKDYICYSCKYLNRNKKKVTGLHNQLYDFGCKISESGYIPGGCVIGDEDRWLKMCSCGRYEWNYGGNQDEASQ